MGSGSDEEGVEGATSRRYGTNNPLLSTITRFSRYSRTCGMHQTGKGGSVSRG